MELLYRNPGLKYSVDSIMEFQNEEQSEWWRESLFAFYPQIDRERFESLKANQRYDYIYEKLLEIYEREQPALSEKMIKYNQHWELNKPQIEEAFSAAFQLEYRDHFNNMRGNISLNPISPRYLDSSSFDVFYLNSERGALGMALHEITHFVWFYVWQRHFKDDLSGYETPHLKWVFSEMAVDPIMRGDDRLKNMNPYFNEGCAYRYFYSMMVDGKPILETLYSLYKHSNITEFMEQGYAYCEKHEEEIRKQME